MKNKLLIFLCFLLEAWSFSYAQYSMNYRSYENMILSQEALSVRCFIQDKQGLIWVGSDKGLFSYDGYIPHPHFLYGNSTSLPVNCALLYGDDYLLLGSQKGILMYNYKRDVYETFPLKLSYEVQSMVLVGKELWIGSMSGLFRYDLEDGMLERIWLNKESVVEMVYSVIFDDGYIYIGSHVGFSRYSLADKQIEHILPARGEKTVFVNSLLKDNKRDCIWVGTGSLLVKYTPATNTVESKGPASFVKSMSLDSNNNLVIGTDNGVLIYNEDKVEYVKHDSHDLESLANNIVWAVYIDADQNVWLGTDYGISMSKGNRHLMFVPIHQLSGSTDGNLINSIYKDSRGYYWLGGNNGLIRTTNLTSDIDTKWYMTNNPKLPISHNHIRHIFEDKNKNLWVSTDGGINRYDSKTAQFVWYNIQDSSGIYNSNWGYHLSEDRLGNLLIATCLSGILVINKQTLQNATPSLCIAEKCYTTADGLAGNFVYHIVFDHQDNVWALVYNTGIDKINTQTNQITHIPIPELPGGAKPILIECDNDGYIWVAFRGGVIRIEATTLQMETILFANHSAEPLAMIEVDNNIWVSSSNGIWIVNKKELKTYHQNIMNRTFTGMYYDRELNNVCLGTNDGLYMAQPEAVNNNLNDSPILITALYTNGLELPSGSYQKQSIRYIDHICLEHDQNTFTLEFSDLNFSQEQRSTFIYKFNRKEEAWHMLRTNENVLSFSNLEPGTYSLLISRLGVNGEPSDRVKSFQIEIKQPWYFSTLAKGIYFLLLGVLTLWTIYFFRVRNQLRFERLEKEQTLEQSKFKTDFFSEISHEFKTPLSLIIAPLSQLLLETKRNPEEKKMLNLIYQNAMKLSSLIHQAIDFSKDYSKINTGMITSHIEFVEFAKTLFSTYIESMKDKHIAFIFSSKLNKIYLNVDIIKIESVLNNLLANACKFTNEGDSIMLSLDYPVGNEMLEIKVSDTGIGIPVQDQPYIFQRFFQSSNNLRNKEGTGIGLCIVKKFVELHGGTIRVESNEENGTSFIVCLPVEVALEQQAAEIENPETNDTNKPLIVVVDDNTDMAEFICNMLQQEYRCLMAHNGKIGLKLITELLPDLVIADVMMPVMDGLEMCSRLKSNVPTSTIPIILLTAKDDKTTELSSINLNVDAFISKPFDTVILLSRIHQLIASKQQVEKKVRIEILAVPKVESYISQDEKLLANVTQIIEENIADPDFNVIALCEIADINQKQLYRKIKQLTGMTTIEYIKSIKLKKAALLLTGGKFTVQEVMYMVGFSNHSYFAKCFFVQFGKTPNQCQKSLPAEI
jgi:signal transduction histidine kinase/AraC-like DNA-binding protein/streptogramin lyase/AmiR/NasT family two-component response regulator